MKAKQHMPSQWCKTTLAHNIPQVPSGFSFFFCRTILIQSLAQANNFKFPAMASPRRDIFLILVRIRFLAHERASGWPQSGGSHHSDSENWQSSPCSMYPSSKHLPSPLAVDKRQLSHWLTQSVLISSMTFKLFLHCVTCELEVEFFFLRRRRAAALHWQRAALRAGGGGGQAAPAAGRSSDITYEIT